MKAVQMLIMQYDVETPDYSDVYRVTESDVAIGENA